jgi:hypothetical protein
VRRVIGFLAAALAMAAAPSAAQVGAPAEYRNPVHDVDFADPFVLSTATGWYAYATHRGVANIQIAHSTDLVTWRDVGTALPVLPLWATGPLVWAPSVLAVADGHVLYYAVRERASGRFCVSAATSALPSGPFLDRSAGPLVCQHERGGTIDPSPFVDDDGRAYLLFKSEGVAGREPTRLWSQRLRPDGLALEGAPAELLATALAWEAPIVENPAMTRGPAGGYHLLYSGGRWSDAAYAVGWAVCDTPLGPCRRGDREPLLRASPEVLGPGGADFFTGPDAGRWIAYHGWVGGAVGYPEGRRALLIGRMAFVDGRPWVDAPTVAPVRFDRVPGPPPPPVVAATAEPGAAAVPEPMPAATVGTVVALAAPVALVADDPAPVVEFRPPEPDRGRPERRPSSSRGQPVVVTDEPGGAGVGAPILVIGAIVAVAGVLRHVPRRAAAQQRGEIAVAALGGGGRELAGRLGDVLGPLDGAEHADRRRLERTP